jgi:predicted dehydrogenase
MKIFLIGLGSIAKKHITAIRKIEPNAIIYALRSSINAENYENVINVFSWECALEADFILISNPTNLHGDTILKALEFKKPLFIEKPLLHHLLQADEIIEKVNIDKIPTYVACVLRFHPVISYLKEFINNTKSKVDEVNVYCGSYLPNWRADSDYRQSYSANKEMGGGVHLDLIHEIDYLYWLFGKPLQVKSTLRDNSHLDISAIDYANYQLIYSDFVASVTLNYFRKQNKREIEIVSPDFILNGNLISYSIKEEIGNKLIVDEAAQMGTLYDKQMSYFLDGLKNNSYYENDVQTGIEVLKIVLND